MALRLYEPVRNRGAFAIGTSLDTPELTVECLDRWVSAWRWITDPNRKEILRLGDSGGSHGYRGTFGNTAFTRPWPKSGITVVVYSYPPGASRWNPVERRLFSFIS